MNPLQSMTEDELLAESSIAYERWRTSCALMNGERNMYGRTIRFFRLQQEVDQCSARMQDIDLEFARRGGHVTPCPYLDLLRGK